jgi:DNA invertase Pin-like site-specific DNA recombinase
VRPELDRLTRAVSQGQHTQVYVWRLDRLTRRGIPDTLDVVQRLRLAGCQLISVTEGFDFTGAMGELLVSMLAFGAQMESAAQIDRQSAARARLEAEGRAWGRPPTDAGTCEKIRALRAEGRSIRAIAMAVKVPRSTVFGVLKP